MDLFTGNYFITILNKLINSTGGIENIKNYFYDFLTFTNENGKYKGCLLTNTINELDVEKNEILLTKISDFANTIQQIFVKVLRRNNNFSETDVHVVSNHLLVSLQGLSVASKSLKEQQLKDFIEMTFKIYI